MPAVTYLGARDVFHCSAPRRNGASANVFVGIGSEKIGISCEGHPNTKHKFPKGLKGCPKHAKRITTGSLTVKVNGRGCGRVGDAITACTSVAQGSPNVFAGG